MLWFASMCLLESSSRNVRGEALDNKDRKETNNGNKVEIESHGEERGRTERLREDNNNNNGIITVARSKMGFEGDG